MKQVWQKLFLISLPLATLGIAPINTVRAQQVVPDNTLGAESSVVTPFNPQIDIINGGATRGANVFHSFQQFNVDAGRGVYFSNPVEIQNIFSRVTGSNPSNINGVLGVVNLDTNAIGNANLFLINPNGIIFGPNARLDVGGSFFASTANSLVFGNGFEFSATNPQAPPLLSVNIPIGLRFRDNPGGITVRGSGHEGFNQQGELVGASNSFYFPTLDVPAGKNLALVGGNVNLEGGVLQAPRGLIELGGLAAAGTVGINSSNLSLSFPNDVALADVSLTNQAGINVIANEFGGGSININARNIGISGQSLLTSGITNDLGTVNNPAGDITLNATGETRINQSRIENNVNDGTIADNSNINIKTGSFVLTNKSVLDTSNLGSTTRLAGDVKINASETVGIIDSNITSRGRLGQILIGQSDTNNSSLIPNRVYVDNSTLSTTNTGTTFAGDIKINARDLVSIKSPNPLPLDSNSRQGRIIQSNGNSGTISIGSETFSPKVVELKGVFLSTTNDGVTAAKDDPINAGDISIYAQDKIFLDQSFIETLSRRRGDAGNVTLQTNNGNIELAGNAGIFREKEAGSVIYSNIDVGGQGNAGTISITTGNLTLKQGSQLQSLSSGNSGNAGNINIQASGDVSFSGFSEIALTTGQPEQFGRPFPSGIFSSVALGASGSAGIIDIQAKNIFLSNGANLNTQNDSIGSFAGNILLKASDLVSLDDSTIFSDGQFGNITIGDSNNPSALNIPSKINIDNSTLSTTNSSTGNAGFIVLNARDQISLTNQSNISSNGQLGYIAIGLSNQNLPNSINIDNSRLSTTNFGTGDAGYIVLNARDQVSLIQSGIFANTAPGSTAKGGNVIINTTDLTVEDGATITVSSPQGQAGNLEITAKNIDLDNGSITAETAITRPGEEGANITLKGLDLLSLRNNSLISARATSDAANGGNINIDASNGFVVAFPGGNNGSDIIASASRGQGGNIKITAQSIFGLASTLR